MKLKKYETIIVNCDYDNKITETTKLTNILNMYMNKLNN